MWSAHSSWQTLVRFTFNGSAGSVASLKSNPSLARLLALSKAGISHLPPPSLAIKSNPDPYVLRLLASLGAGFDCASSGEIINVLGLGVIPSRIIFANPCKATSFIRHAAKSNVEMMTFDNSDELYKIARSFPTAKLIIRIHTDDTKALCRLNLKFGASLVAVPSLLAKAKELGLNVVGVSFHVGSGCFDSSAFADAIRRSRSVFDMGREVGYEFSMLDIGGGFEDATFDATALTISSAINTYFPDRSETGLRIIAEPGRYFVSKTFSLATNVIARRTPTSAESEAEKQENPEAPSVRRMFIPPPEKSVLMLP